MAKERVQYDFTQIEEKWQEIWEKWNLFQGTEDVLPLSQEEIYILFAFAYPSGSGLHVGHVESKTALDILSRYYRMNGKKVFFPVGWDAFGLPAENYAIKTGTHPEITTREAIATFQRQLKRIGISYDWENEIATCDPEYYKWTQWMFSEMYKKGLAYQDVGMVNWCNSCQTVLANEQVATGVCDRCSGPIRQKEMKQWFFRITKYQDELISGLDKVDWPESTKKQQRDWIGKSEGANIRFLLKGAEEIDLTCFTTRADTIFGVTFLAISPEKFTQLGLEQVVNSDVQEKVLNYLEQAERKTEEQRQIGAKQKTGVDTGLKVINPVTQEEIPLFIADYILSGYGTGIVMGVPGHDQRDFDFAKKHDLNIIQVIANEEDSYDSSSPIMESALTDQGVLVNSGEFSGLSTDEARKILLTHFPESIEEATSYKLRDWLVSRQRYWGAPIPIVYDPEGNPHLVKQEHLPWMLPTDVDFKPTGESPLKSSTEFIEKTEQLYGKGWRPEFDTMDTFVDSSWYYLRYVDSHNSEAFASQEQLRKWLPVDFYMIGAEHIVLHLLYSRFFTKFLYESGFVDFDEPYMKMRHQGMILGADGKKMSKRDGNVINPDDVVAQYGADTLRVYEMFMGPIDIAKPWDDRSVAGVNRFLSRVYNLVANTQFGEEASREKNSTLINKLHQTLKKVSEDIPELKFNTAIAAMMSLINQWENEQKLADENTSVLSKDEAVNFIKVLAPFAPFLASELFHLLVVSEENAEPNVHLQNWPEWDEALVKEKQSFIPVQVNGKMRGRVLVDQEILSDQDLIVEEIHKNLDLQIHLSGKEVTKVIYVKGKIINFITN